MQRKNVLNIFSTLYTLLIISVLQINLVFSQNLIQNPGCEDTLINGEIPYWTEIVGTNWTQRENSNPPAFEGNYMFFPGVASLAKLQQDVDVSNFSSEIDNGDKSFIFQGYVRAYNQSPPDQSRIMLEYFDLLKTVKLDSFDSGNYSNTSEWVLITDTTLAPAGTRYIRIWLISNRRAGSNNDGYYDALSLVPATASAIEDRTNVIALSPKLSQNYPNPFNPKTTIEYQLPKTSQVDLSIYNLLGQKVTTLVYKKQLAGNNKVEWDASGVTSGVYFYKLETDQGYSQTKKLVVLK